MSLTSDSSAEEEVGGRRVNTVGLAGKKYHQTISTPNPTLSLPGPD